MIPLIRAFILRLKLLVWGPPASEVDEEVSFHIEQSAARNRAAGMTGEQARRQALVEFGGRARAREQCHQARPGWWLGSLAKDFRFAARLLVKSPGYTVTSVVTLTLAIGANTAIFGLIDALLLRSLPVERADRIAEIKLQLVSPTTGPAAPSAELAGRIFDAVAAGQHVFSQMCAWRAAELNLRESAGTRPVHAAMLSGGCFKMLGLDPALGRLFTEADDRPGGGREGYPVVLAYDYWRTHLGADPAIVGRVLDFEGTKGVVVGVLRPGFESVNVGDRPWIYVASEMSGKEERHGFGGVYFVLARLKDEGSFAGAQAEIEALFNAWIVAEKPSLFTFSQGKLEKARQAHLVAVPGRTGLSYMRSAYERPLYLVEGMVGLSLVVACAYLAMLAATRGLSRRRELAVRIALGASRTRVAGQLCAESVLVALAGSLLGLLFAWAAGKAIMAMLNQGHYGAPLELHLAPDGIVLAFTLGLSVLTVLVFGVGPAWRATRLDPVTDIKEGGLSATPRRRGRLGMWLVPVQIGFSLVIVAMAALMRTTMSRLMAIDPGFRSSGLFFVSADFTERVEAAAKASGGANRAQGHDADKREIPTALYAALLERIRNAPGVEAASIAATYQMSGALYVLSASSILPSGQMRKDDSLMDLSVSPGYFKTLGIPLLGGRDFSSAVQQGAPQVCILSRSAAEYFFPHQNAVGKMLAQKSAGKDTSRQVVGVVGDTLYNGLRDAAPRLIYLPYLSGAGWDPRGQIAVRASDRASGLAAVPAAFGELAPDVPLGEPVMMSDLVSGSVGRERLMAVLAGFFAVLTLTLTAIGIYGLMSYGVRRRQKEIGIRIALGASRASVARLVVDEAMWLVLPGLALGAIGIWAGTRLLGALLFGVKPLDPWRSAASFALLLGCALAACAIPARRASSVDPLESLRLE
jgi:predicted permease